LRDVREARRTVNAYALAFLDRHLKGLDAPSNAVPRIVNWRKKQAPFLRPAKTLYEVGNPFVFFRLRRLVP